MPAGAQGAGNAGVDLFQFADQLPTMVAIADRWGGGLHFNAALQRFVGRDASELADLGWLRIVHPDERDEARRAWLDAVASGAGYTFDGRMHHAPSGRYRWCTLRATPLPDAMGAVHWWCMVEDTHAQHTIRAQQAALAQLGRTALQATELDDLLRDAVHRVADTLEVEYCKVLEHRAGTSDLLVTAGVGWRDGTVGHAVVPSDAASQAGYTLNADGPVVMEDVQRETRFHAPALLREHGVASGMSVTIDTPHGPYGILGAHARAPRNYTPEDTRFLQGVANILGEALRKHRFRHTLQERTNQLQTLADHAPAFIARFDAELRHLFVNRAVTEFTGLPPEALLGRTNEDLGMPPDLVRDWNANLRTVFASGRPRRSEFSLPVADGEHHFAYVVAPERNGEGEVQSVVSVVQDVTELKQAERASRAHAERYGRIFENAAIGIAEIGLDGRIESANERSCEVLGRARDELIGTRVLRLVHPDDRAPHAVLAEALARGEVPDRPLHARYLRQDGSVLWGRLSVTPVRGPDGAVQNVIALLEDVTAAREAQARSKLLESVVVHARDAVLVLEGFGDARDWRIRYANPAFLELHGATEAELAGQPLRRLYGAGTDPADTARIDAALSAREPVRTDVVLHDHAGRAYEVEFGLSPVVRASEERAPIVAIIRDVTERRRQQARIERFQAFRERLASLTQGILGGVLDEGAYQRVLDYAVEVVPGAQAGSLMLLSPDLDAHFVAVHGFDPRLVGFTLPYEDNCVDVTHPEPTIFRGFAPDASRGDHSQEVLFGDVGRAQQIRATLHIPIHLGGRPRAAFNLDNFESSEAFDGDAVDMARLFGRQIATILQRLQLEESLAHQAHHDPVTGLPNRRFAERELQTLLRATPAAKASGSLLLLDVDDFKHVNEAHGHAAGDALLVALAERLRAEFEDDALITHWSGDEFMVLAPGVRSPSEARNLAWRMTQRAGAPFSVDGATLFTGVSVGVALFPQHGDTVDALVRHADIALHEAKRRGKRTFALFTPALSHAVVRRIRIEDGLRETLEHGALRLHYQPRVELQTASITAVEALARWRHPTMGPVPPNEFIPVAEASGLIHSLGDWVLDAACRQARRWIDAGIPRRVCVNVSMKQLHRPDLVDRVRAALERHGVEGRWLELEVTESAIMTDVDDAIERLTGVRALGVSVSIDDFGTAYSSLAYLRLLPVDTLKIDRSFVTHLGQPGTDDGNGSSLIEAIVDLGRSLDLRVVAEGVESPAQSRILQCVRCDEAQGYLYGRPRAPEEAAWADTSER